MAYFLIQHFELGNSQITDKEKAGNASLSALRFIGCLLNCTSESDQPSVWHSSSGGSTS
jgi:hypothetical protein